jgi:hypothetical protein
LTYYNIRKEKNQEFSNKTCGKPDKFPSLKRGEKGQTEEGKRREKTERKNTPVFPDFFDLSGAPSADEGTIFGRGRLRVCD